MSPLAATSASASLTSVSGMGAWYRLSCTAVHCTNGKPSAVPPPAPCCFRSAVAARWSDVEEGQGVLRLTCEFYSVRVKKGSRAAR
jgi:hypothetical protein